MESKSSSICVASKEIVGVASKEIFTGVRSDLKVGDEDVGRRVSKGNDGEAARSAFPSSGMCRTCCISLDMEEDGRIGMWIDPEGGHRVVVDGTGLCEDCEYKRSIETDPNWGRSRRISSEERSCEEKFCWELNLVGNVPPKFSQKIQWL